MAAHFLGQPATSIQEGRWWTTGSPELAVQAQVPQQRLGQGAHLAQGKIVGMEPPDIRCFIAVRSRRARRDGGIEDDDHVRRPVAVRIGHSVLGSTQDSEQGAEPECDPGLLLGLATGGQLGGFIRFDCATDCRPVPRVDDSDQKDPTVLVPGQDGYRRSRSSSFPTRCLSCFTKEDMATRPTYSSVPLDTPAPGCWRRLRSSRPGGPRTAPLTFGRYRPRRPAIVHTGPCPSAGAK